MQAKRQYSDHLFPITRMASPMINAIGLNGSERALKLGLLYSPTNTLRVNLIDEVVPETEVLEAARLDVTRYLSVPGTLLDI